MFDCFNDFMMIVLTWFRNYMQITPHQVQINFYIQDVHKKKQSFTLEGCSTYKFFDQKLRCFGILRSFLAF